MPKLKRLSGSKVLKILAKFDFTIYSQKGSHIKLRRITSKGKETLTIPNHKKLDTGTCYSIFKQASKYISEAPIFMIVRSNYS